MNKNKQIRMIDYSKYSCYLPEGYPVRHRKKDLDKINIRLSPEYRRKISEIRAMNSKLDECILSFQDYYELVVE